MEELKVAVITTKIRILITNTAKATGSKQMSASRYLVITKDQSRLYLNIAKANS